MTREEMSSWLFNAQDEFDYSSHEPLQNLSFVYESDEDEFEVTFAVPQYWLLDQTEFTTIEKLQHWLCNKYTSEDSGIILDKAIKENKIAFWFID